MFSGREFQELAVKNIISTSRFCTTWCVLCNKSAQKLIGDLKGGRLLTTILLLGEVPNHHILETLTSIDKLLRHVCSKGKVFKIFESQPYLAGHATWAEKNLKLKRHTVRHKFHQSRGTKHYKTTYDKLPSTKIP